MANYNAKPPEKYKFGNRPQPTGKAISEGMKKAKNEKEDILFWIKKFEILTIDEFEKELLSVQDGNKDGKTIGYKIALSYFKRILDGDMKLLNSLWDRKYGKVGYTENPSEEATFDFFPLKI